MRSLLITLLAAASLFAQGTATVDAELEKGRQLLPARYSSSACGGSPIAA